MHIMCVWGFGLSLSSRSDQSSRPLSFHDGVDLIDTPASDISSVALLNGS